MTSTSAKLAAASQSSSSSETRRLQKTKKKFLKQSRSLLSRKKQAIEENALKKASELGRSRFPGDGDSDSESSKTLGRAGRHHSDNSDINWTPLASSSPVRVRHSHGVIARQDETGISPRRTVGSDDHPPSSFHEYKGRGSASWKSSELQSWMVESLPDARSCDSMVPTVMTVTDGQLAAKASSVGTQSFVSGVLAERQVVCQTVTGRARQKELLEKNSLLESQLAVQTKVNAELKKLLVASVGDDLEYRFQRLVQDKADVEYRLKYHLERALQDSEEIERLAIQSDVWRSKFVASSVMVDELASWKAKLFVEMRDCQKALNALMKERTEIYDQVVACHQHLTRCMQQQEQHGLYREIASGLHINRQLSIISLDSNDPKQVDPGDSLLQLCRDNSHVSEVIAHRVIRSDSSETAQLVPTVLPTSHCHLSAGETLAKRALAHADAALSGLAPKFQRQEQLMKRGEATKRSRPFLVGESWNTYTASSPIFPFSEMGKTTGDTLVV